MPSPRALAWTLAAVMFILLPFLIPVPPGLYVIVPVLLLLLSFAGLVVGAIAARFNKDSKAGKRFGILFLVCVAAVVGAVVEGEWQSAADRAQAERIIAALDAYQKANGRYPDTLARLVPAHIDDVGRESRFFYRTFAPGGEGGTPEAFELAYPTGFKIYQVYNSLGRTWAEDAH